MAHRRKDGRWEERRAGRSFYGRTRKEAVRKADEWERSREGLAGDCSVYDLLRAWLEQDVIPHRRPNTVRNYRRIVRAAGAAFIGTKAPDLKPQDVERWVADLRARFAPNTVRSYKAALSTALNYGVRHGLLARNVASAVRTPAPEYRTAQALTADECRRFLAAIRGHRYEHLWAVALLLGLRPGEALGLTWDRVDFAARTVRIDRQLRRIKGEGLVLAPPKSRAGVRLLPMTPEVERRLRSQEVGGRRHFVFATDRSTPLDESHVAKALRKVTREAGLPDIRFHDLRHSFASLLFGLGTPVKSISEHLGHAGPGVTQEVYVHTTPVAARAAATALEELLGEQTTDAVARPAAD